MKNVFLLDCTLRDGGYVNDWMFGEESIKGFCNKIAQTGIEMFEVGFIKGDTYNSDRAVFPDFESIKKVIAPKKSGLLYFGMLDMSSPIPLERIPRYDGSSFDGIRVIFKKNKIDEAYTYCKRIKELGYILFVNFVGTDQYSDIEFESAIKKFNAIDPYAMAIVDSFGVIKRKRFIEYVKLADKAMTRGVMLAYHAHNNLQQAFANAEALVEMNLDRSVCIDACVFGMGRGAGNLNLELFAEYLNENHDKHYRIEPMLEIMDEYLSVIYQKRFWGYALPFYLSASAWCHPNYAIYFEQKATLTVKALNELLNSISDKDKANFSKETAEEYYQKFQENFINDTTALQQLKNEFEGKSLLLIAPGASLEKYAEIITDKIKNLTPIVVALNFVPKLFPCNYIFSSNMRRYDKIDGNTDIKCIITSNMKSAKSFDFMVNFSSYIAGAPDIVDNSGLMFIRLALSLGVKKIYVAGMDGYSREIGKDYFDESLEFDFSSIADKRNSLISQELAVLSKDIGIEFITPSQYEKR